MPGKPNILVIWGDDIGYWNISAYSKGMMGYTTPNIDRIANEGMTFTDCYGEQSCTAGRAAFIMGQSVFRSGLSKVGLPGAELGMRAEDPTIAELLKPLGYATGQFGKNHLGDRDEQLPTMHGFDEFFGNLYHLNAGGTGTARLPVRIGVPQLPQDVWSPWRASLLGQWEGRSEDREHRGADQETDGDDRRRICGGGKGFHYART
jgi:arylsulfatase A-like enzyme